MKCNNMAVKAVMAVKGLHGYRSVWLMFCCTAWWLCVTLLSRSIVAQQSQDSFQRCYNLTTATHCFKTARNIHDMLQTFAGAISRCKLTPGYALAKIENAEVQTAVEQFLEEFELTSDDVWISAKRTTRGQWTWVNGDVFTNGFSFFYFHSRALHREWEFLFLVFPRESRGNGHSNGNKSLNCYTRTGGNDKVVNPCLCP